MAALIAVLNAVAAAALGAASAKAAARAAGQDITIVIGSVTPDIAGPGARVTVSGWLRNGTRAAVQGADVQLWSSGTPLNARWQLDAFAAGTYPVDSYVPGTTTALSASIGSGQTATWRASFQVDRVGIRSFGVYPLAAAAFDSTGAQLTAEHTFLPFWPRHGARPAQIKIAWVWPLIDQPHRGICPAMLDNGLAASLAGGGRLDGLLQAGRAYADSARLTWAVDPALLDDAKAMTHGYQVLYGARCWQASHEPASSAASAWLTALGAATAARPVFFTPYADPDVAALTHQGLDANLRTAFAAGYAAGRGLLARPDQTIAWPPDGIADSGVLANISVQAGRARGGPVADAIRTVVLDSAMMPTADPAQQVTPDAVTEVHTGVGSTLRVLLADHELTALLAAGSAAPGSAAATTRRFLAETAMIAAQVPATARSVVVAPPQRWDPGTALASQLLGATSSAPWLQPSYVSTLTPATTAAPGGPAPDLVPLPSNQIDQAELTHRYLTGVRSLDGQVQLFESILSRTTPLEGQIVARLESAAWRGRGQARGLDLLHQASSYLGAEERLVSIIPSSEVTLGGYSGVVPVSIDNKLGQPVQVRLQATVPAAGRLSIGAIPGVITVGAGLKETVRLRVRARSAGLTEIRLRLLTPHGAPIPGSERTLRVRSTALATLALVITAIAVGVLIVTLAARVIRRGLRAGRPGSVMAEGNAADDDEAPEAPDELAQARGGAQPDASREDADGHAHGPIRRG